MNWYEALVNSAKRQHGIKDLAALRESLGLESSTATVATYYRGDVTPYQIRHSLLTAPLDCSGPFFTDVHGRVHRIEDTVLDPYVRDILLHDRVVISESTSADGPVVLVNTARFKWIPQSLVFGLPMDALCRMVTAQTQLILDAVSIHAASRALAKPWIIRCPSLGWDRDIKLLQSDSADFGMLLETLFVMVLRTLNYRGASFSYCPSVSASDLLKKIDVGTLFVVVPCQTWCLPGGFAGNKTLEKQIADLTTLRSDTWWFSNDQSVDFRCMYKL